MVGIGRCLNSISNNSPLITFLATKLRLDKVLVTDRREGRDTVAGQLVYTSRFEAVRATTLQNKRLIHLKQHEASALARHNIK